MPYTGPGDADLPKHVQELPEDERAQWVAVWNDTYADCKERGGDDCEGEAFQRANGVVKDNQVQANTVDKVYRTSWEGRDWLVVPTVMIKEGVLNGELVPAEELAKFPAAWNGRPFVIDHPRDGEEAVSANDPMVMDQYRAGFVFGTEYRESDKSVPAELWIDVERTKKLKAGPELIDRVLRGDQIEVSTGYFRDLEKRSGEWQGKAYNGVARNLRPDHLAALLESVGACSWEDGCGCPRVNECEKDCGGTCEQRMVWTQPTPLVYQAADKENEMGQPTDNQVFDAVRQFFARAFGIDGQDNSQEDVEAMARSKAKMVSDLCKRLEIAEDENGEGLNALSADTLRKILNAFGAPDEDEPEEEPEEELMPEEAAEPETQADAETEDEPDEDEPEEEEPQANEQPCAEIAAQQADVITALERRIAELEQRSEASMDVVRQYQEAQRREKDRLVADLTANEACAFGKDELEQFDVPKLQKLARSLMPRSYAGQEGGVTANREKDTRPIVPWSGNRAGKEK